MSASGEVRLRQSTHGLESAFVGQLLDVAKSGFRACHDRFTLNSGELVAYEFAGRCGFARAMWTRIIGERIETGFRICEEERRPRRKRRPMG